MSSGSREFRCGSAVLAAVLVASLAACGGPAEKASANAKQPENTTQGREVGAVKAVKKSLQRTLTISSELIPFQQIDVYAKESGFVHTLDVDYGTHVKAGQVMAILEIPELQVLVDEDDADIKDATGRVSRAQKELNRSEAQHNVAHLQFTRLDKVAKSRPGLIAQQDVDDWQGKDLAAEAQVEGAKDAVDSAQSQLTRAQAKRRHDQVLFDYSKITAPFEGVVTKRYANLGTLMQAGTASSTQALPLVQLSQDDLFRLVIPVSESYVHFVKIGDPVDVRIASLNRSFPGKVSRFSVDVQEETRTMHTEVDVPNTERILVPGLYAEATLTLEHDAHALAVPQEAVNIEGDRKSVWVIDPSNKVERRPIVTGIETPDDVQVLSGLREGEWVAVGDRSSLKAGETVTPKEITLLRSRPEQE